ncbi:MAG: lipocalin-like domain-containing protein [bacterium]
MKKSVVSHQALFVLLFLLLLPLRVPAAEVVERELLFPQDEGAHAGYGIEWWYVSGHLKDAGGRSYGLMAAFFKAEKTLVPTHFLMLSLTDETAGTHSSAVVADKNAWDMADTMLNGALKKMPDNKYILHVRKFMDDNREKLVLSEPVKTSKESLKLKYGKNTMERIDDENMVYKTHLEWDDISLDLKFTSVKPPLIVGDNGVIDMGIGGKSYYYSLTRLDVEGTLSAGQEERKVTGGAWFDHQWGNWDGRRGYHGWDWFSVQLENGMDMNLFCFRDGEGNIIAPVATVYDGTASGTDKKVSRELSWAASGEWTSPDTGITYPQDWTVIIADLGITLDIRPTIPNQEIAIVESLGAIWEGSTVVVADIAGEKVGGVGYTELVGYGPRLQDVIETE